MAVKDLIMYHDPETKFITRFSHEVGADVIYAEDVYLDDDDKIVYSTIELAVNLEGIIKMRDFLNKAIEKIKRD